MIIPCISIIGCTQQKEDSGGLSYRKCHFSYPCNSITYKQWEKEKSVQDRKISNFGLYTFRVLYMGHNLLASHTFLLHTLLILIPTNSDRIIEQIMII